MSEDDYPVYGGIVIKCKSCGAPEKYLKKEATKEGMLVSYFHVTCTLCDYEFDIRLCD